MIKEILHYPHPMLARKTEPVLEFDDSLITLVADMTETAKTFNAEGLAATQVNSLARVFVIKVGDEYLACINPVILERTGLTRSTEGCLSFPGVQESIDRVDSIVVGFQDVTGAKQQRELTDVASVAFQHELDHLNGIVFTDHMGKLQKRMALKRLAKVSRVTKRNAAHFQKLLTKELRKVELAKQQKPATV